jgi:hypothetical protein
MLGEPRNRPILGKLLADFTSDRFTEDDNDRPAPRTIRPFLNHPSPQRVWRPDPEIPSDLRNTTIPFDHLSDRSTP